jgi:hypothetical protein
MQFYCFSDGVLGIRFLVRDHSEIGMVLISRYLHPVAGHPTLFKHFSKYQALFKISMQTMSYLRLFKFQGLL